MKKKRQWFMCLGMIGVFTASVILSVFGQRKVKAQLNTENAGKITSSWADEKHICDFVKKNSLLPFMT